MELSFLVWKKRKGQVKESETSHLVDKSIRLNSEGCRLSRERPDGERVGSKVWEGPQDATGKAKGGSRHWARDLVGTPLPPGCRDPAFQAGSRVLQTLPPPPPDWPPPSSQNDGTPHSQIEAADGASCSAGHLRGCPGSRGSWRPSFQPKAWTKLVPVRGPSPW